MVFRTNRRSLKYAPKEFSKVNANARDPPWCYKNTQCSRQHRSVTHANLEWYVLFSQRRRVRLIFKQRCQFTISSWIKIFIHTGLRIGIYGCDLIHKSLYTLLNFSSQQRNKFQQHPTKRQLYGHLPPITKTIQARRTRHAGDCWRSKDELISDVLLWTTAYGQAKAGRPARTYLQQLCEDMGYSPEDLPEAMNDREK